MSINFNLKFDKNKESGFQKDYFSKSEKIIRIGLGLGIFLYAVFGILDIWILPETKHIAWIIRFAVVVPVFLILLLLTKSGIFKKYHQILLSLGGLVAGLGIIVMIAFSNKNEPGYHYYYSGLILVIMWVHTFVRLRFVSSTVVSLLITLCYEITAIFFQDLLNGESAVFFNNNFFFISANVIGMFASYNLESLSRKEFIHRKETEKEVASALQKSEEISTQKEEILQKNDELHAQKEIDKHTQALVNVNRELEQLSVVAKKTDNAIMITDIKGNIEWVNEGFTRLYGYNLDQLFLFKGNNLLNISTNICLNEVIQHGFKGREAIVYETQTTTKFGEKIWVQTTLTPVLNDKKEVIKLVAIDSNINKIKKAEEEILKQKQEIEQKKEVLQRQNDIIEQAFQNIKILNQIGQNIISTLEIEKISDIVYNSINAMMDASVFVIAIHDPKKNALVSLTGKEKGKKLPSFSWELDNESRLAAWCFTNQKHVLVNNFTEEWSKYLKNIKPPVIGENARSIIYYPLTIKDKYIGVITVQSFEVNAFNEYHCNIIKNLALYVSIALDNAKAYREIIEQKNRIEKTNKELEKLSIVASKTDNAVIIAEPDGRVEWVNEGFTRIYGYNLSQLEIFLGNNLLNLASSPVLKDVIETGFKDRDAIIYENLVTTKYREKIWVQTTLTPILNEKKEVVKLVAIDTNIHKRKMAEEEIIRQKDELETQRDFVMRQGDKIASQNVKIKQQRDLVIRQKKEITDSIQYAQRIQSAILPRKEQLDNIFSEYLVLFRPKDIVSGDFYWVHEQNNHIFFAAVDCTGHGVPGAFMSMLGISYLNEIVVEKGITEPAQILTRLRNIVISTLHQTGQVGESKDGMDISLCVFDRKTNILKYSGANNPVYIIRKNDLPPIEKEGLPCIFHTNPDVPDYILNEIKADKMPIGVHLKEMSPFTNHFIPLMENDTIYIFSDGYADQFGGERHKKFMSKKFKDLLLSLQKTPLKEQRKEITAVFEAWKGQYEQVDDVLVIGVKV